MSEGKPISTPSIDSRPSRITPAQASKAAALRPRPNLAAVVGVCDEIELIESSIAHLEAKGVRSIVVVDMKSQDGTRERLIEMRAAGRIVLIEQDNDPTRNANYLTLGVECARRTFAPDWILVQDADEFWISASDDLADALAPSDASVLLVERRNACLCDDLIHRFGRPDHIADVASLSVWVQPLRLTRAFMDDNPTIRWLSARPAAKVVAKAGSIGVVAPGGHSIIGLDGDVLPAQGAVGLAIVHVPFLSLSRFQRKIERVKHLISRDTAYFTGATGWHWRRWVEILDDGALEQEYRGQMLQTAALHELRASGAIQEAHQLIDPKQTKCAIA